MPYASLHGGRVGHSRTTKRRITIVDHRYLGLDVLNRSRAALTPACGYPTLGKGLCVFCIPTAATEIDLAINCFDGASDFNPAA